MSAFTGTVIRSRRPELRVLITLLFLLFCTPSNASLLTLDTSETGRQFPIERHVSFLEDARGELRPEELLRGERDRMLQENQGRSFSFGMSSSTYWLMFELSNHGLGDDSTSMQRLLEVSYPPLDRITLYYFDSQGNLQQIESGDTLPFHSRPIVHTGYVFPLEINMGETRRFLLQVNSQGSLRVPMTLWEPDYFHEQTRSMMLLHGIYFGIVALMFVYNLILFLFIRDQTYLYYIVYIAALTFFQSNYTGFAFQYLWPGQPQLNNPIIIYSIWTVQIFAAQFTRRVLDSATTQPRLDKVIRRLGTTAIVMMLLTPVLSYHLTLYAALISALINIAVILAAAIINAARGMRTARLFLIAWSAFLLGAMILGGVALGVLPANVFTSNALIIGSAIEVTLLSLSLADRMNQIERERTRAELEAKNALLSVNRALLESNKLKDEFLNTISHEMRTPMHGVLSSIDHIRHQDESRKRELFVDSAERSAQQMMMLIDSVLNYTELHSSSFKLEQGTFTLSRLAESLDDLFRKQAEAKGLHFSIEMQPDVPDLLIGDFRRTQQILASLLSNAVKFTHQGFVRLTIALVAIDDRRCRAKIEFRVTDSGIGILEGTESIIFDRFRQLDSSFSRGFGGLGIGLATSKQIARLMQAELGFQSRPNEGSTFRLVAEFPFSPKNSARRKAEVLQRQWQDLAQDRLALIVEDNPVNQMVLKASLAKLGLRTLVAGNGNEAIAQVLAHPVDIVLMDCQMPVLDGFEATRAIRQLANDKSQVPIIAITANAMSKDRERCVEAGMNDYMSKPVNMHELKEKLLKWLPLQRRDNGPS